jgi:hypothetical protein
MDSKISSPYRDDIVISWPELHRDTRILCHALMEKGPFKGIIAIARGGMIPAALSRANSRFACSTRSAPRATKNPKNRAPRTRART